MRTSECGFAASKRLPSRSVLDARAALDGLVEDAPWVTALEAFRSRAPRRVERLTEYERLLTRGVHRSVGAAVLAGSYRPDPPVERWINKADGRKKRVFQYRPRDELLFRVVNRLVQPVALSVSSPWCQSFLPGGGPRVAFRDVLRTSDVAGKGSLRLDVRDYFNSIDPHDLLVRLPEPFLSGPLRALLAATLLDARVERHGAIVRSERKGVMAGTPLAPTLATLYLADLDREVASSGASYARYSDDILVLAEPPLLTDVEHLIRTRLAERGLEVNETKSLTGAPGAPWSFLGFRYDRGVIGLSENTIRKFRAKSTRLGRRLHRWRERDGVGADRVIRAFVRRTNRRLYGAPLERADFSWGTWFLPVLTGTDGLVALDHHVQRELRYAATGRRTERARVTVKYTSMSETGYLPLVSAYWAMREGLPAYDALVARRTGLARRAEV